MATPIFKCIHASDLHLEQTIYGMESLPVALLDPLLDAPYLAAESIFSAALSENVDCMLLTGDILSPQEAGPRSLLFFVEQCERLARRGIPVYWAPGGSDPPGRWQAASLLPQNVHRLHGKEREIIHRLPSGREVRLLGPQENRQAIRSGDYPAVEDERISLALGYGTVRPESLGELGYHYWALGGEHLRETVAREPTVHYPGTPQGRSPQETGPRGCTLVEIDTDGLVQTSPIVTDAVRWSRYAVEVDSETTTESLYAKMRSELGRGLIDAASRPLLISWRIAGNGPLVRGLQATAAVTEWLEQLNAVDCDGAAVWHVGIEVICPAEYPEDWYAEETIRGEFLRTLKELQEDSAPTLNPVEPLPPGSVGDAVSRRIAEQSDEQTALAVKRAADLGVYLLSGEDESSSAGHPID